MNPLLIITKGSSIDHPDLDRLIIGALVAPSMYCGQTCFQYGGKPNRHVTFSYQQGEHGWRAWLDLIEETGNPPWSLNGSVDCGSIRAIVDMKTRTILHRDDYGRTGKVHLPPRRKRVEKTERGPRGYYCMGDGCQNVIDLPGVCGACCEKIRNKEDLL